MKKGIHANTVMMHVKCATCGNEFDVLSNKDNLVVEQCNECHPAYTGKAKQVVAAGRVDKFNKKYGFDK